MIVNPGLSGELFGLLEVLGWAAEIDDGANVVAFA